MASQTSNHYKTRLLYGDFDFSTHAFRLILMIPGFAFSRATHDGYADVIAQELATAFGYTAGGVLLAGVAIVQDDVLNAGIVSWNNASWLAALGNIEASGAIIYDDTVAAPVADPIVGYIDFGGSILTYNGGTFTVANITVANTAP